MSQRLISHNADLSRLQSEGYSVSIISGHLVVRDIPYVNSRREVRRGVLVSTLELSGDKTNRPGQHVAMFVGDHPCKSDGSKLTAIENASGKKVIGSGLDIDHTFSSKPAGGYNDYHHKMTTYAGIISGHARVIEPDASAQVFKPIEATEEDSVFKYLDTASARAGITACSSKLAISDVAIVGLGGTGSYVLDLIAKTPIQNIHLFDSDTFYSHNAFRSPGAAGIEELHERPTKVHYLAGKYALMRRNIFPNAVNVNQGNLHVLDPMQWVFLCMDTSPDKLDIIRHLESIGVSFIDVGLGIVRTDDLLSGIIRTTTSTPSQRSRVWEGGGLSFGGDGENLYDTNIQVADLNALNACLAVIKWKKIMGFYRDIEHEFNSLYTLDGNHLLNEALKCEKVAE